MTLADLKLNEECIIKKINTNDFIKRRLENIGLVEQINIKCVLISPFNDPKAYKINGIIIAIRNEDAKNIEVDLIEKT